MSEINDIIIDNNIINLNKYDKLIEEPFLLLKLIKKMCCDFLEINIDLEKYIKDNNQLLTENFMNEKMIQPSNITNFLFELEKSYFDKLTNIIIFKNSYFFEIIFGTKINLSIYNKINPTSIKEIYLTVLIDKNELFKSRLNDKYIQIDYEFEELRSVKKNINILMKNIKKHNLNKMTQYYVINSVHILSILNTDDFLSIQLSYIMNYLKHIDLELIKNTLYLYNHICNDEINIEKFEKIVTNKNIQNLINEEMLNITTCRKNKDFTIIDYQNSFVLLYQHLYLNNIQELTKEEMINILKNSISKIFDYKKNKLF